MTNTTNMLADITAQIISAEKFTYRNLWAPTNTPYDFTFHVDRKVFEVVLQRVRGLDDVDIAAFARSVDITTSLVVEMMGQATRTHHLSMNLLHAGAVCAVVVCMIRTLTTPNPPEYEMPRRY